MDQLIRTLSIGLVQQKALLPVRDCRLLFLHCLIFKTTSIDIELIKDHKESNCNRNIGHIYDTRMEQDEIEIQKVGHRTK